MRHIDLVNQAKAAINAVIDDEETYTEQRYDSLKELLFIIKDGIRDSIPRYIREDELLL